MGATRTDCDSTTRKLAEIILRPLRSKDFLKLDLPLFCSGIGLENIDGLAETVFEIATNGILFLISTRWSCQNVTRHSGGTQRAFCSFLLKSLGQ
jgi:hypothetical protein